MAISEETILKAQHKFFPLIMDGARKVKITDKEFKYATSAITTVIKVKDIKIDLEKLKTENISIKFNQEQNILLKGSNIQAWGSFTAEVHAGYIPSVSDTITILVKNLNVDIDVRLGMTAHPTFMGKNTVSATIVSIITQFDFDFKFNGTILNTVKNYFKETIKSKLFGYFQAALQDSILPLMNKSIYNSILEYPVYADFLIM